MIEEYSRKEIVGYMILALENTKMEEEQIKVLISRMETSMSMWTEDYAEEMYGTFYGIGRR